MRRADDDPRFSPGLTWLDSAFINAIVDEIQEACRYFHEVNPPPFLGCPEIEGISDETVEMRVRRIDEGENTAEAIRSKKKRYPLQELPRERKRALIERIERLKREWQFEFVSDEEGSAEYNRAQDYSRYDTEYV